jgi:DtxR family Mn-dependent transcriptional regulator
MPSVTQALQRLADAGLVNYSPRTAVTLTEAGTKLANELDTRHKILNEFFNSIGLAPEKADELACLVEHDIDLDAAMKIKLITGHLRECEGVQKLLAKDSN